MNIVETKRNSMNTIYTMRRCIYCDQEKPSADFSLEHIFPRSLGGALCSDLFKTNDVCRRCNNIVGLYIDGAFIKSWFHKNDEALAFQEYIDPRRPTSSSPLMYMGRLKGLSLPNTEECEMWLGPCGTHYYHIHQRDEQHWASFAGGHIIGRKSDPGRVYIWLTTAQAEWVSLALRSMVEYFPNARRFGINIEIQGRAENTPFLIKMDDEAKMEAKKIIALPDKKENEICINTAFEQRFLAKIALGLGYKILGHDFLITDYAKRLRNAMWEKELEKRAQLGLRGSNFLNGEADKSHEFMGWKGAYTIRLHAPEKELILSLHFPSSRVMHLVMSDEPYLWQEDRFAPYREGVVFLILPQLRRFTGPIPLFEYISHRLGTRSCAVLQEIETQKIDPASLPACR